MKVDVHWAVDADVGKEEEGQKTEARSVDPGSSTGTAVGSAGKWGEEHSGGKGGGRRDSLTAFPHIHTFAVCTAVQARSPHTISTPTTCSAVALPRQGLEELGTEKTGRSGAVGASRRSFAGLAPGSFIRLRLLFFLCVLGGGRRLRTRRRPRRRTKPPRSSLAEKLRQRELLRALRSAPSSFSDLRLPDL